jgi:hypothetical protein
MPVALPGSTRQEQANVGEQIEEMLNSPGFQALAHALHLLGEERLNSRLFRKTDPDGAAYADTMGHIRGLKEVVPIAKGLVQNGKDAAQALREEED